MLSGRVDSVTTDMVLIDVCGVGYEVRMPASELMALHVGEDVKVFTSLNVSQDAITLYGFTSLASKRMFLNLQKVSGIGPRVALSLLSTLTPDALAQAVTQGNATALAKAPGLGKKGAQKIILELSGKLDLDALRERAGDSHKPERDAGVEKVVEGLISLGWREADAAHAVEAVCKEYDYSLPLGEHDIPNVLKQALTSLDRGR